MSTPSGPVGWLDEYFLKQAQDASGNILPARPLVQYTGSGVTVTDDAINNRVIVSIASSSLPSAVSFTGDLLSWGLTTIFNSTSTSCVVSVPSAAVGNLVHVAPPATWPSGMSLSSSYVSTAGFVNIVAINNSGATQTIPTAHSDVYKVRVYT